jgi:hypothetical protein
MLKPPWIYPPKNYTPFFFGPNQVNNLSANDLTLGTFTTSHRFTRISSLFYRSSNGLFPSLCFDGDGFDGARNMLIAPRPNKPFEVPVFLIIPPNTQVRVHIFGQLTQLTKVRILGWEFDGLYPEKTHATA